MKMKRSTVADTEADLSQNHTMQNLSIRKIYLFFQLDQAHDGHIIYLVPISSKIVFEKMHHIGFKLFEKFNIA